MPRNPVVRANGQQHYDEDAMPHPNQLAREIGHSAAVLRNAGLKVDCSYAEPRIELANGERRLVLRQARAQALLTRAKALWRQADTVSFEDALLHVCEAASADLKRLN